MKVAVVLCLALAVSYAYPGLRSENNINDLLEKILMARGEPLTVRGEEELPPSGSENKGSPKSGREEPSENPAAAVELGKRQSYASVSSHTLYKTDQTASQMSVQDLCVYAHNHIRGLHGTATVKWDPALAAQASAYAYQLAQLGYLTHASGQFGENLYRASNSIGTTAGCAHAVLAWYAESYGGYNYMNNVYDPAKGHFTQVMWDGSSTIGCGVATSTAPQGVYTFTNTYVVCRYTPAGNMANIFINNLKPPLNGQPTITNKRLSELTPGSQACYNYGSTANCKPSWCSVVKSYCECTCP